MRLHYNLTLFLVTQTRLYNVLIRTAQDTSQSSPLSQLF